MDLFPTKSTELVGNLNHVKNIQEWLLNSKNKNYIQTLVLTGPSGCGKSTSVEVVCRELNIRILKFDKDKLLDNDTSGITQLVEFLSSPSYDLSGNFSVLMVSVLPDQAYSDTYEFRDALSSALDKIQTSVIFCLTEINSKWYNNPNRVMSTQFCDERNIEVLKFKPITRECLITALATVATQTGLEISIPDIEKIAEEANGNLRLAINSLRFPMNIPDYENSSLDNENATAFDKTTHNKISDAEWKCLYGQCLSEFGHKLDLYRHFESDHVNTGVNVWRCYWSECNSSKRFKMREDFINHLKNHSQKEFDDAQKEKRYSRKREPAVSVGNDRISDPIVLEVDEIQFKKKKIDPVNTVQLDAFQKEAIMCIERNQSVLVMAQTSALKAVIATSVIDHCLRKNQRIIYSSPINSRCVQQFNELVKVYKHVGLITGEVTINPNSTCLVITTEMLRREIHIESNVMKDVEWVIFDEIHHMGDKELGVAMEESIILMDDKIKHVYLTETIPNASQFAQWVSHIKKQQCHVVTTDLRQTPLQHLILPIGSEVPYEVLNVEGEFREEKFREAMSCLAKAGDKSGRFQERNQMGTKGDSNVLSIIPILRERNMMPFIVFSFSRNECESYARSLKYMNFNTEKETEMVKDLYNSALSSITEETKNLPFFQSLLPLLRRGIGFHHSGLLPILKETIEILFGEGLLKVLFATETFSMGLNMPAQTVLFTSARKFDGTDNRFISSREYIQMSGRAGRSGKDARGMVILMVDQQLTADEAKHIIKGTPDPLISQFRLTYNTILNFLSGERLEPIHIIENSFRHFQNSDAAQKIKNKIVDCQRRLVGMHVPHGNDFESFRSVERLIEHCKVSIAWLQMKPENLTHFVCDGKIINLTTALSENVNLETMLIKRRDILKNEFEEKLSVSNDLKAAEDELKKAESILKLTEFQNRKRVLRRLGYCSSRNKLSWKGLTACEMFSAADDLVLSEMFFQNVFNNLDEGRIAAILSCFVLKETCPTPNMSHSLSGCLKTLKETARKVANVSIDCGIKIDKEEFVNSYNPGLMAVVYHWINDATFYDIIQMTDISAGAIIQCFRRLGKVIHEIIMSAAFEKNVDLQRKLKKIEKVMKRDVFADSFFITFLRILYGLRQEITICNIKGILDLAFRYNVQFLLNDCEDFLISYKWKTNVKKLFYARHCHFSKLQLAALEKITVAELRLAAYATFEVFHELGPQNAKALLEKFCEQEEDEERKYKTIRIQPFQ